MTVKDLKAILRGIPDETPIELFNSAYEWYGIEDVHAEALRLIKGRLVIHFGGSWGDKSDPYEIKRYLKDKERG